MISAGVQCCGRKWEGRIALNSDRDHFSENAWNILKSYEIMSNVLLRLIPPWWLSLKPGWAVLDLRDHHNRFESKCIWVCMYIIMHLYIYICQNMYRYAHTHTCITEYIYNWVYIYIHTHTHIYIHIYIHTFTNSVEVYRWLERDGILCNVWLIIRGF